MEPKLSAFLKGEFQPSDNRERLPLAGVCQIKKLNHTAAGLYAAAFVADPKLADDLKARHRYNAACHAALAAAGQGEDAAQLDDTERTRLRGQALDWLRPTWPCAPSKWKPANLPTVPLCEKTLRHWQQDTDLAGHPRRRPLAKLPRTDRKAFTQLWDDVAKLLKKAQSLATKEATMNESEDPRTRPPSRPTRRRNAIGHLLPDGRRLARCGAGRRLRQKSALRSTVGYRGRSC